MGGVNPRGAMRLQRALSQAGVASRRESERMIQGGRVSVNGNVVREMGTKVRERDTIRVDGKRIFRGEKRRYVLINKPAGVICTLDDPEGRQKVTDLIPKRFGRLYPVGRLDFNSEGALLLTNDGDAAHRLTHPKFGIEKVYFIKIRGILSRDDPRLRQIEDGVEIGPGELATVQRVTLVDRPTEKNSWVEFVLTEGKNREIRRICDAVGLELMKLTRRAYGPIQLAGLKPGRWRELTSDEIRTLKRAIYK